MPDKRGSASQRPKPRFPAQLPGLSSEPYIISQGGAWSIGWCAPVLFTLFHAQPGVDDFEGFVSAMVSLVLRPTQVLRLPLSRAACHCCSP